MNNKDIIIAIDIAVLEVENYIKKYDLPEDSQLITHTLKVLSLLKNELFQNKDTVNERLLRGFKDICTTTAIHYEHTNFNDAIFNVNEKLEQKFDNYKYLELLRMDFGKGEPI